MNQVKFKVQDGKLLYSKNIAGNKLEVRDSAHYRWFTFGGEVVQSLMNKKMPQQVMMPICQSMLLCLLWKKAPLNILNLGMGAATFERFFSDDPKVKITSVEKSSEVISIAKNFFELPEHAGTICQCAESYLQHNSTSFDLILCDVFNNQENIACLNQASFYQKLSQGLNDDGIISINLDPENEANLLRVLRLANRYFSNITIIEFKDYKNVVLILSASQIPEKQFLIKQNTSEVNTTGIDFSEFIVSMHYLPAN